MTRYTIVYFFLLLASFPVAAQFKNLKLDEANGMSQACEPGVAINRKDPKNIVVSSSPDNVYYSVDGGLSWKKTKVVSPLGVNGHAIVTADDKDNFFYLHLSTVSGVERIVGHESKDGGATWSEGELIDDDEDDLSKDQRWFQVATDSKGNLYTTWTQSDKFGNTDSTCRSLIVYSKSSNGKKWSRPVQISQTAGRCVEGNNMAAGASMAMSSDGKAYVVWANNEKIFFDRSFNGGDMWLSTDLPIINQPGGWNFSIPGHSRSNGMPQLAVDYSKGNTRGSLYLTWADQHDGDTEIWFVRSHNGGDNWTTPIHVNNDTSKKHQYFSSMAIDQTTGNIYFVYYDRREHDDESTDVYLACSVDGGSSFQNVKISESPFKPEPGKYFGDYISIAAHKGVITPVWTRIDEGKTSIWTAVIKQEQLFKVITETQKKTNSNK